MSELAFYHLTRQPLAVALPKLLERVLAADMRAVVRVKDAAMEKAVDEALWTYDADTFLPHGTAATGYGDAQPVYITKGDDNPAAATVLVVVNDASFALRDTEGFERTLVMFEGDHEDGLAAARERWKAATETDMPRTYWQQSETGGWSKKDV